MYGVGKSSTTGSTDTTGEDDSSGGGLGKRSLVESTFGAASGIGEKRGREDEDDRDDDDRDGKRPRGRESGGGGANASDAQDGGGFPYKIAAGVGSFAQDQSPAISNEVQGAPAAEPQEGTAYVGNVITIARGKDKTPVQVAAQYRDEAFDDPSQAQQRFALVVGVNRMETVTESADAQQAPLDQELAQVQAFQQFPLAAFRRLWRPAWRHTEGPNQGQPASFDEVRAAAARHQAEAVVAEAEGGQLPPVGPMRTATTQHPQTTAFMRLLQQRYRNVFIHVGDSDAVNLKAKTSPTSPNAPQGLFDRYDQVLADASARGADPKVVSGGYHFRVGNQYMAPDQQHADPHAGTAGRVSPQTAASSMLDMQVREGLAREDPSRVYFPEPNMLIHSSVADRADFGPSNNQESKRLVESVNGGQAPDKAWAKQHMVFDTRAGLHTDGGRFDAAMTQEFPSSRATTGAEYGQGTTDVDGLFHPQRNPQSIAKKRELGNAIARMNGDIGAILDVYLPQQLINLTGTTEDEEGVVQSTLDRVRDYLSTYAVIAGGIDQVIRQALADPDLEISKTMSKAKAATAVTAVHGKVGELDDFSTTALGDPQALSQALVTAIGAAKSFIAAGKAKLRRKGKKGQGRAAAPSAAADGAVEQELQDALDLCKSAAIATAGFLAQFFPQAAQAVQQPQPVAPQVGPGAPAPGAQPPQLGAQPPAQQGGLGPGPMDLDPPGPL